MPYMLWPLCLDSQSVFLYNGPLKKQSLIINTDIINYELLIALH